MSSRHVACSALVASVTVVLHGCGGGDSTTTKAPTPPAPPSSTVAPGPTPPPTTTTTGFPTLTPCTDCTEPWDPQTAMDMLNAQYMGFDETNDTSPMGVTISMASVTSSFNANIFCAPVMHTQCFKGQTDCRLSASLFNHKVIVNQDKLSPTMDREVGYVFDQSLTEDYWGKCAYIWDGADFNNLNNGCGAGATGNVGCVNPTDCCDNPNAAFFNQCDPANPHTCTRNDEEVQSRMCKGNGYGVVDPPVRPTEPTCFYEMPALIYGSSTTTNHLRDSLKERVALQGNQTWMTETWNEIVIDDRLLIPKIQQDPAKAIRAFVCVQTQSHPTACDMAKTMRDEFLTAYNVQGTIPVLRLDPTLNFTETGGPFRLPDSYDFDEADFGSESQIIA